MNRYSLQYLIDAGRPTTEEEKTPDVEMNFDQENITPAEAMDTSDSDEEYLIPMFVTSRKRAPEPPLIFSKTEPKRQRPE